MALAAARLSGDGNQLNNHVRDTPFLCSMLFFTSNQLKIFQGAADYLAGNALIPNEQFVLDCSYQICSNGYH
jgi:hypothetical protein